LEISKILQEKAFENFKEKHLELSIIIQEKNIRKFQILHSGKRFSRKNITKKYSKLSTIFPGKKHS